MKYDDTELDQVTIVSFRLGGTDGVSVETAKWCRAYERLGWRVSTVAGEGRADHILAGLAMSAPAPPSPDEIEAVLADADLVVVENVCSLPLNLGASAVLASALAGRPAILHHHDLAWERPAYAHITAAWPPDDVCWQHVCISDDARASLTGRGLAGERVHRIYNSFDPYPPLGDRDGARAAIGAAPEERVVLQPTRAIERKNVPAALALAERLGATYWLLGEAEDGYGPTLEQVIGGARGRVLRGSYGLKIEDAYAASDVVALPSSWEGFGNPSVEAGLHGRPVVVGDYPVAAELMALGFRWLDPSDDPGSESELAGWNAKLARRHLSTDDLPHKLAALSPGTAHP
jgi:mannosylglucosylglycerate synthase